MLRSDDTEAVSHEFGYFGRSDRSAQALLATEPDAGTAAAARVTRVRMVSSPGG
jgi:hypothetical protein